MWETQWTPLLQAISGRPYRAGHDLGEARSIPAGTLVDGQLAAVDAAEDHQLEAILLRSQDACGRIRVDRVDVRDLRGSICEPGATTAMAVADGRCREPAIREPAMTDGGAGTDAPPDGMRR